MVTLNAKRLESLGAQCLAEILVQISTGDAPIQRRVLELARAAAPKQAASKKDAAAAEEKPAKKAPAKRADATGEKEPAAKKAPAKKTASKK